MTDLANVLPEAGPARTRPMLPYLVVGLVWYVLFVIAANVRTMEPVFLWVAAHSLVMDRVPVVRARVDNFMILLAAYVICSLFAWLLVERPGLDRARVWRRAILSWLAIQAVFCLAVFVLGTVGVLHE